MSFAIFLVAGVASSTLLWFSLMAAVWGAPISPLVLVALLGSVALVVSAFVTLAAPATGRIWAIASLLVMGVAYIPSASWLVPLAGTRWSPIGFLIVGAYLAVTAFALLYPSRLKYSRAALTLCVTACVVVASSAFVQRSLAGKLREPSLVFYEWSPAHDGLTIDDATFAINARPVLERHHIKGVLRFSAGSGDLASEPRVIVLCSQAISAPRELPYPKNGTIVYTFDGTRWQTIPPDAATYPTNAILRPDGMVQQPAAGGGYSASHAFSW